jgi:YggT family protein
VSDVLQSVTGPILNPIRRRMPTFAGLDLSPWVAVLLLTFVQSLLVGALGGH